MLLFGSFSLQILNSPRLKSQDDKSLVSCFSSGNLCLADERIRKTVW